MSKNNNKRNKEILSILKEQYKDRDSALNYSNLYELLIAVILSAQTNDNQVNKVTKELFKKYNSPEKMSQLNQLELEEKIKTIGLYRNKAKNVLATSEILLKDFDGEVPQTRKELMTLPGVGRKTANVVLSVGFNKPALAVDTHVFRVSHRLGLATGNTPEKVEQELYKVIPEKDWSEAHHWLIWHGRDFCKAQNPNCKDCPLNQICTFKLS